MNNVQRVGVVTVTHNSNHVLEDFLDSLWKQTHTDFLLYIIDSASTDGTQARIHGISDLRIRVILSEENIGFAAGSNLGIKMALKDGCDAVLLLNNDIIFEPELFQRLLDGLDMYNCDMTTPKMLYHKTPNKIWAAGGHLNRWLGYKQHHDGESQLDNGRFTRSRRVTFTPFCCVLMRSSVFNRIGYLDEAYFVYTEDVDYCYRALKDNLSIWYLSNCKLWHKVSSLTGNMSEFTVRYCYRNRIYFLRKHLNYCFAFYWYIYTQTRTAFAHLIGRTTLPEWKLRRAALNAGWNMHGK